MKDDDRYVKNNASPITIGSCHFGFCVLIKFSVYRIRTYTYGVVQRIYRRLRAKIVRLNMYMYICIYNIVLVESSRWRRRLNNNDNNRNEASSPPSSGQLRVSYFDSITPTTENNGYLIKIYLRGKRVRRRHYDNGNIRLKLYVLVGRDHCAFRRRTPDTSCRGKSSQPSDGFFFFFVFSSE